MRAKLGWTVLALGVVFGPSPLVAQARIPLFAAGFAGGSFTTDDSGPAGSGGGFAYQAQVGLRLPSASFGVEYSHHDTGADRKTKIYGGFLRVGWFGGRSVHPYFVAGLGSYRFNPASGRSSTLGGSIGPGLVYRSPRGRVGLLLEARFHTTFDRLSTVNSQDFFSAQGGLELGL